MTRLACFWPNSSKVKCWICETLPVKLVQMKSLENSFTQERPSFNHVPESNTYLCVLPSAEIRKTFSLFCFRPLLWFQTCLIISMTTTDSLASQPQVYYKKKKLKKNQKIKIKKGLWRRHTGDIEYKKSKLKKIRI